MTSIPGLNSTTTAKWWRDPTTVLLIALGITAFISLMVYVGRGFALLGDLRLFATSGGEGVIIHNVWKAAHGFDVYLFPDRDPFDITLYNYLFFFTYGRLSAWCGMEGDALVTFCRFLTLSSAILGAFAQWRILGMALGIMNRRESAIVALLCFLTWYGTFYMNWWLVSVRPDVPAVALATTGLWLFLMSLRTGARWWPIIFAIIAFYAAWSFKQSVVWMLSGTVAGALSLIHCRRQAMLLAVPTAIAFATTLVMGTEAYRYQILTAPALSPIIFKDSVRRFFGLIPPLAIFWIFAALHPATRYIPMLRRSFVLPPLEEHGVIVQRILAVICIIAVTMGFIAIGKDGSGRNHLMEAVVAISSLAAIQLVQLMRIPHSPARTKIIWLAAILAATLCMRPIHSAFSPELTGIRSGKNEDVIRHQQLAAVMRDLPKPVFVRDDIQSQAWNSTDGKHPAVILDPVYYFAAKKSNQLLGGGLPTLFTQQRFASILIAKNDSFYDEVVPAALAAGYQEDLHLPPMLQAVGMKLFILKKN